jgi:hypothetical protein
MVLRTAALRQSPHSSLRCGRVLHGHDYPCYLCSSAEPINARIIDWSFASLLGVVGIYHTARGFDELFNRRRIPTTMTESGVHAARSTRTETTEVSSLR